MNNIKIAKELIKLAKDLIANNEYELNVKLSTMKSKQGVKNYIRNYVDNVTKGKFRDEDWSNVKKVFDKIKELGVNLNWYVENGGYSLDGMSKTYKFDIDFENVYNQEIKLSGQLICCFCGIVEDPKSAYDMIFQIF
jgi:exonuclease III